MRYLPLIVKNAFRNPRRTLLTVSSLAVSLCLLGVMAALYYALFVNPKPSPGQELRLVTRHKVSIVFAMPIYYRDKIRNAPGVKEVVTWQWFGGLYQDEERDRSKFFPRLGAEADRLFAVYPEWRIPEEQKQAFLKDPTGALVGAKIARRFGWNVGDRVVIKGNIFTLDLELTVRGIYESPGADDENLWFQLRYIEEWLKARGSQRPFAGTFTILAQTPEDVPRIAKAVDEMFANTDAPTRTESEQAFGLSFLSFLGNIKLILMAVCGAVTFTILLVAANTMAMSVRERVREVGVLKTLGFTRGTILGLLLGESAAISLIGGGLGLLLAQGLCFMMRQAPAIVAETRTLGIQPPVLAALLALSMLIGVVSAFIPAWSAARTTILDALRFTD